MDVGCDGPLMINLTVTSRCNLKCVMCDHAVVAVKKEDVSDTVIEKMAGHLQGAGSIDLTGLGEPLLSPQFWKILDLFPVSEDSSTDEFKIYFNSNGTLFNEVNIDRILKSGVKKIMVSVDSGDAAMNFALRGIRLQKVVSDTKNFIRRRNAMGRTLPKIGLATTLMKANLKTAGAVIDLCEQMSADFVEMWSLNEIPRERAAQWSVGLFNYDEQMLSHLDRDQVMLEIDHLHWYAQTKSVPLMTMVLGTARWEGGFPADDWGRGTEIAWKDGSIRCPLPWQEQRVHYAGDTYACCWGAAPIGNIQNSSAEDLWRGEAMTDLRQSLIDGRVHNHCAGAGCPYLLGRTE